MRNLFLSVAILLLSFSPCSAQCNNDVHLFILSGQSNMSRMPLVYFSDAIHAELGTNRTVIVKHAISGMPISMWDETLNGRIYTTMMDSVLDAIEGKDITTVTFIWAQGPSDVLYNRVDAYLESFDNVLYQLMRDLGRDDIRLIIARVSDWGDSEQWYELRGIQEFIGDTYPDAIWVNTDDLNGPWDSAHFPLTGYKTLAERYADIILNFICEGSE